MVSFSTYFFARGFLQKGSYYRFLHLYVISNNDSGRDGEMPNNGLDIIEHFGGKGSSIIVAIDNIFLERISCGHDIWDVFKGNRENTNTQIYSYVNVVVKK